MQYGKWIFNKNKNVTLQSNELMWNSLHIFVLFYCCYLKYKRKYANEYAYMAWTIMTFGTWQCKVGEKYGQEIEKEMRRTRSTPAQKRDLLTEFEVNFVRGYTELCWSPKFEATIWPPYKWSQFSHMGAQQQSKTKYTHIRPHTFASSSDSFRWY